MEAVGAVAAMVAGGAAAAAVGGGIIGAVVGGIVSIGVSYLAREVSSPSPPAPRAYPTPTPPPPRIYTPPPPPAPVPVITPAPYQAPYQAPYHTQTVAPSLAPTLAGGGLTQMVRQPVTAHRIVYGEVRVGGPVVYLHTRAPAGSDKLDILHLVVFKRNNREPAGTTFEISKTWAPIGALFFCRPCCKVVARKSADFRHFPRVAGSSVQHECDTLWLNTPVYTIHQNADLTDWRTRDRA